MVGVSLLYSTKKGGKSHPFPFFLERKFLFEAFTCEIKTPFMKDACIPQPEILLTWSDGIVKTTCVNWHFVTP